MRESPWTPPSESRAGRRTTARAWVQPSAADLVLQDRVRFAERLETLLGHLADDPDREAGGERLAPDHALRQPELFADASHLVLKQQPQRLDDVHLHVVGQAADVWWELDRLGHAVGVVRTRSRRAVERPWTSQRTSPRVRASSSKTRMNSSPIGHALLLGIGDAGQPRQESLLRLDVDKRHVERAVERLDDLFRLALA